MLQGLVSHERTAYLSFLTYFNYVNYGRNYEWHNSIRLSFMNILGLRSDFVDCESFLESNSPDILAL